MGHRWHVSYMLKNNRGAIRSGQFFVNRHNIRDATIEAENQINKYIKSDDEEIEIKVRKSR